MWTAILSFLLNAAKKVKETAEAGGKLAAKGGGELLKQTDAGKLYSAFKGTIDKGAKKSNVQDIGQVPVSQGINQEYDQKTGQPISSMRPKSPLVDDAVRKYMGYSPTQDMLSVDPNLYNVKNMINSVAQNSPMPQPSTIPPQYQQFSNQPNIQSTPMNPSLSIPSQYQNMTQPKQDVGVGRGFIDAALGMPQPEGLSSASQGRKTAYYAGGLIPNIVMSKLGQPSPAEATAQQQTIQSGKLTVNDKQQNLNLQSDLSKAVGLVPNLSPEKREGLYSELVAKYPDKPTEIRRILFPDEYYGKDKSGMNQLRNIIFNQ